MTITQQTLSVVEAIRTRRTVRHYRPDPVSERDLDVLLELAAEAPSSWNLQDRSIVVVSSEEGRAALAAATGGQPQALEAPVLLVFLAEPQAWREDRADVRRRAVASGAGNEEFAAAFAEASTAFQLDLEERGLTREYAVKDAVIAASFLLLAATELGLATSPMNGWGEEAVKAAVGVGGREDIAVALLVALGHPAENRPHPGRRSLARVVSRERYPAGR
ncbi:nitroreductase family protein [Kitasatospora albolonga]|uniref:nitroreductase family protein n=1 Tax=Kitasatospora albolonga TaxID=68173 RepID=UPI0031EB2241